MLKKIVNSKEVVMSAEEEADIRAEWAAAIITARNEKISFFKRKAQIFKIKLNLKRLSEKKTLTEIETQEAVLHLLKLKLLQKEFE